jgi:hypothetical protein
MMKNVKDVSKILTEAYADGTPIPDEQLVVDMSPHPEITYRLRTHVFQGQDPIVYFPKHL